MARRAVLHRDRPVVDAPPGTDTTEDTTTRTTAPDWAGGEAQTEAIVTRVWPARVSVWAVLSLVIGLVGLCAALTGLLAPEGFALGVIGVIASIIGMVAARRPAVTGRGVAVLGLLAGVAAVVLAVLAMTGRFGWLNSRTDEIAPWHGGLVAHWSWLGHW